MKTLKRSTTITLAATLLAGTAAIASAAEVNIYSARHYQTDEQLYNGFTEATGIKINRIEDDSDKLISRIEAEGRNSPADILVTVDAGRLWRAEEKGIFAETSSETLTKRIPASLRHPDGEYFGFSKRARLIFFNKAEMKDPPKTYEALADPKYKGEICIRSSSNMYNLSLMASMIEAHGEEKALEWAKGVVANMARAPKGGDTDQIRAAAAGECGIAVANHYYFIRLMTSDKSADQDVVKAMGVVFPNQDDRGTHVNISGAGVLKHAPNKENAVKFLEYLASDKAQQYFAVGNYEYPVVETVKPAEVVADLGHDFKQDPVNVSAYGRNQAQAQKLLDQAGWK